MIRVLGTALLALGGTAMGFCAAREVSYRAEVLNDLAASLSLLEQDLELGGYSLQECFRALTDRGGGAVQWFFTACVEGMDRLEERPFPELWSGLSGELPIGREGRKILSALGEILGRCETERQMRALRTAGEALVLLAQENGEQCRRQGRVYQAVGMASGAFLAILLL